MPQCAQTHGRGDGVSEEAEAPESGVEGGRVCADPAALSLALSGASRGRADAFLDDQRRMLHLQMEEMRERNPFELSHLHWQRFTDRMKAALQVMTAIVGLAVFGALCTMVWKAAHSDGLIVESFTVPPELAQRGLTGQVVATRLLDRLTVMQNETTSSRPARSYANNWGDDLKVEIPETGVSLGEVWHFLRDQLGHETRVNGEVIRTATGIAVTARNGGAAGATVTGPEADLDTLLQQAAEHVYGAAQPYRYASFLNANGRVAEALAIDRRLAASGPATERSWGYNGWSSGSADSLSLWARIALLERAMALWPDNFVSLSNLANIQFTAGRAEASLASERKEVALVGRMRPEDTANDLSSLRLVEQAKLTRYLGAYQEAAAATRAILESDSSVFFQGLATVLAEEMIGVHDLAAARAALPNVVENFRSPDRNITVVHGLALRLAEERQDWRAVTAEAEIIRQAHKNLPGLTSLFATNTAPRLALAQAHLGDFAAAAATIAATPGDCNPCLIARAKIAALQKQNARADWWFARAVAAAPSIPFAYQDWGRALLARGDADGAIAQFTLSNKKGPHFADAIEGWGEALMAKSQSHLALAKFAEAEKYAPNWGRLHLKWGEALVYSGKPAEAAKHFARAAALDLPPSEKAELRKVSHG